MSTVQFRLLGTLEAQTEAGSVDLGPPKQRAVLAVLLLNANEVVPIERIIDLVWGEEPPRTAYHSVQLYVSDLRKALANGGPTNLIETRPPGYVLNTPPDTIDSTRFENLVRDGLSAARTGDTERGRASLERALEMWTSAPLADFVYEDFAQSHSRLLTELHVDAAETLASIALDHGDNKEARSLARRAIETDPLREEPHRQMMMALYRSGRQAEALREFGDYKTLLGDELGIEPSPQLHDLEERILLQDPTLQPTILITSAGDNPYRGLRAFSDEDADVYFGREELVEEVLHRLEEGHGFVSIVGPSGSGKSSAAQAGVVPSLREAGQTVVTFQPGARPLWELAGALDRAGAGSRSSLLRRFEANPGALADLVDRPITLIIDQFEEAFTLAEADEAARFGASLARAVRHPTVPISVVTTLRADFYDRPLALPDLAGVFSEAIVSVKPMTPKGIESAVIGPARTVGCQVEPALLAQLVADMGDQPGALPLLQFTLFEMFEGSPDALTLAGYEEIGGINGALARGAEETLDDLPAAGKAIVEQLFMRMVQKGRADTTARPATLRDLLDIEDDRMALQEVLEAFGSRRLITFNRDASGAAVVEIAHEYLLNEWPQLENWIQSHSEDLDRLAVLGHSAEEWESHERSDDYLLRGDRLASEETWAESTGLRLTKREAAFLEASVSLRDREETAKAEQEQLARDLDKKAKRRLWAFGGTLAALAAAVTFLVISLAPDPPPDVVVWGEGRDGNASDDLFLWGGIDLAAEEFGVRVAEFTVSDSQVDQVEAPILAGTGLVIMETLALDAEESLSLVDRYPDTLFFFVECPLALVDMPSNAVCAYAADGEVGFLAGVVAAQATQTGRVGFMGGVDFELIHFYQAGFEQGVAWVDSEVVVDPIYLTGDNGVVFDWSGFNSPGLGEIAADHLLSAGSDVVFHAAAASGVGMLDAMVRASESSGEPRWGIAPDVDEANRLVGSESDDVVAQYQQRILTSIVKRFDLAVFWAIEQYLQGDGVSHVILSIENGGIDYVTSMGHIDPYVAQIEEAKRAVIDGAVSVELYPIENAILVSDLIGS